MLLITEIPVDLLNEFPDNVKLLNYLLSHIRSGIFDKFVIISKSTFESFLYQRINQGVDFGLLGGKAEIIYFEAFYS